jgi:hypothetical protein
MKAWRRTSSGKDAAAQNDTNGGAAFKFPYENVYTRFNN